MKHLILLGGLATLGLSQPATAQWSPNAQQNLAVRENVLRTPGLVTPADYAAHLTQRGRGWLAEAPDGTVAGFAIVDLQGRSIWALFVHPEVEGQGLGRRLHRLMLDWYFAQTTDPVWLSTAPGTRAEAFYRRQGWHETGRTSSGEVRFEMPGAQWLFGAAPETGR